MKPEIRVFAGPNGSGKSTIAVSPWILPPYVNADDIQRSLSITNLEAAQHAEYLREEYVATGTSFTFETVLSTDRNLNLLRRAKERGFFIKGYYIFTVDPNLNVARVAARVSNGGHDVPTEKIVSRYWRSRALLPQFLEVCDICHIYDNTDERPVRIVRKHKESISIYPNTYWSMSDLFKLIDKTPTK